MKEQTNTFWVYRGNLYNEYLTYEERDYMDYPYDYTCVDPRAEFKDSNWPNGKHEHWISAVTRGDC